MWNEWPSNESMPGMPGMGGARKPKQVTRKPKKGQKVSGNPAKRAAAAQGRPTPGEIVEAGAAFGVGAGAQPSEADLAKAMENFSLPPEMQKMLKNQGH